MELISILMASDRVSNYLDDSILSIFNQTYENIELIFVCNGNNNENVYDYIIKRHDDKRLKLLKTPIRQLAYSMNLALSVASGNIVARMDADDISVINRLELQYNYLKKNNLTFVGSFLQLIDETGNIIGYRKYPIGINIKRNIFSTNPFAHNTIMCYKNVLIENRGYLGGFNTEDYDMWLRLNDTNINWDNMELYLVKYRIHDKSSQKNVLSYAEASAHIYKNFLLKPTFKKFIYMLISFFKVFLLAKKNK